MHLYAFGKFIGSLKTLRSLCTYNMKLYKCMQVGVVLSSLVVGGMGLKEKIAEFERLTHSDE